MVLIIVLIHMEDQDTVLFNQWGCDSKIKKLHMRMLLIQCNKDLSFLLCFDFNFFGNERSENKN